MQASSGREEPGMKEVMEKEEKGAAVEEEREEDRAAGAAAAEEEGEEDEEHRLAGGGYVSSSESTISSSDKAAAMGVEQTTQQVREQKSVGGAGVRLQIPPDFRCPLSLELMSDPVIVASGQTYERAYIQQWLDQGNTTCPKTRQTLTHTNLIPNYTVKALIANWCEAHDVPLPESAPKTADALNTVLRPLNSTTLGTSSAKANNAEQQPESSLPGPVHESVVPTSSQNHRLLTQERSLSNIGSRPPPKSRRTFHQPRSFNEREFERNGFQVGLEDPGETSQRLSRSPRGSHHHHPDGDINLGRIALLKEKYDADSGNESSSPRPHHHHHQHQHRSTGSGSSVASSVEDGQGGSSRTEDATATAFGLTSLESSPYHSDVSGELEKLSIAPSPTALAFNDEAGSPARPQGFSPQGDRTGAAIWRRRGEERDVSLPRIVPSPMQDNLGADGIAQLMVDGLVLDLESSDVDVHRRAAAELRLLAKYNMENRIIIANSGAIKPLVALLKSTDPKTQENAVTALLNLSINDNNKSEIAAAGAIYPLVNVLKVGNTQAMENAAATLFSLSVMDDNKVTIGASGAIPPLVHLLINGTPRGKKDAATALFNLSIFHENKARIVRAGAIKPLVELMADPAAGMVDKAVAVLANLATIPEGRFAIGEEAGIPALVEVVEAGSQRGKENAAAALLQLCMNSHKHRALVLQEGAIPPLVALSQSGTARAKEKASALLRYFREQRHQVLGRPAPPDKHTLGPYYV